jgi:phosphotransferase system IIA component
MGNSVSVFPTFKRIVMPVRQDVLRLLPHAYVIMTADNVGVLVHLGLDTVQLNGAGFTTHVAQGDTVTAGQLIITYDVPAIVEAGYSPVVPVVVMDEREPSNIIVGAEVGANSDIASRATLFTANK